MTTKNEQSVAPQKKFSLFSFSNILWLLSGLLTLGGTVGMRVCGSNNVSPFIQFPQDTLSSTERWARSCFAGEEKCFFISDFFFAIGAFGLFCLIYRYLNKNKIKPRVIILFVLTLLSDLAETGAYFYATPDDALSVQTAKEVLYGLSIFVLVYYSIKYCILHYLEKKNIYRAFFRNYFTYLYPGIISIVVLVILFSLMDQFDSIIVELTEPLNLGVFAFLFLSAIVKVWYIPYYAQFTDGFYGILREKKFEEADKNKFIQIRRANFRKVLSWGGLFFSMRKFLRDEALDEYHESLPKKGEETLEKLSESNVMLKTIRKRFNKMISSEKKTSEEQEQDAALEFLEQREQGVDRIIRSIFSKVRPVNAWEGKEELSQANKWFHLVRRWFGLVFISALFYLQYGAAHSMCSWKINPIAATAFVALTFFVLFDYLNKNVKEEQQRKNCFYAFGLSFAVFVVCLIGTGRAYQSQNLHQAMQFFLGATFFSGIAFMFFTVFRYPKNKDIIKDSVFGRLDIWASNIMTILLLLNTLVVPFTALGLLAYCWFGSLSSLHVINPANFYLLFVTGLICTLSVLDRIIKIYIIRRTHDDVIQKEKNREKIDYKKETEKFLGKKYMQFFAGLGAVLIAVLVLSFSEDYHHEVNYLPLSKGEIPEQMTLREYTENFLNKTPEQDTVFLVAAEGGGLRAAYWTMLTLNRLGDAVYDNTFMMSGASGGGIGQGIYNYLYYKEFGKEDRSDVIEELARHNFLTTDLAGLLTRSAVTRFLPKGFTKGYADRHYFMEKGYWNVIAGHDKNICWSAVENTPYFELWQDTARHIPALIVNTTRTEDGSRAVVHPFAPDEPIFEPYLNISTNYEGKHISYPDAVFLTNRFPVASPAARVEGRGHFVDGGYFENTGLKTILHTLSKMRSIADTQQDSVYQEFLSRKIVLISIRNSREAYVSRVFRDDKTVVADSVNRSFKSGELTSVIAAAAGSGMTGLSNYYSTLFQDTSILKHLGICDYYDVTLPHRMQQEDPHKFLFQGQIVSDSCNLNNKIKTANAKIKSFYTQEAKARGSKDTEMHILMPPLGRMMNSSTADYMKMMLDYDGVMRPFELRCDTLK